MNNTKQLIKLLFLGYSKMKLVINANLWNKLYYYSYVVTWKSIQLMDHVVSTMQYYSQLYFTSYKQNYK